MRGAIAMISVRACSFAAALLLAMGFGSAAQAVPIVFTYTGLVSFSSYAGASASDTITFKVFADNGGPGINGEFWSASDITGASFTAGTYSASTSGFLCCGSSVFVQTDASGNLTQLLIAAHQSGTDTSGNTVFSFFMNTLNPIWFTDTAQEIDAAAAPNTGNTTIALVPTPLPAALPLLATALGGLGFASWRRKRASDAPRVD